MVSPLLAMNQSANPENQGKIEFADEEMGFSVKQEVAWHSRN